MPRVTIGIPTVGSSRYLAETLLSAIEALPPDGEIVLSDNASANSAVLSIHARTDPRVRVVTQPARLPMAESWNACLAAARGRYFLLLSDDDLLGEGALEPMVDALERNPQAGFCAVRTRIVDDIGRTVWLTPSHPSREPAWKCAEAFFARKRVFYPCSMLFRTADLLAIGGYETAFGPAADVAAWLRCSHLRGQAAFYGQAQCSYREHAASTTIATSIVEWRDRIRALGHLAGRLHSAEADFRLAAEQLADYMAMDLVAKTALAGPGGLLAALRDAVPLSNGNWPAMARIAAKMCYYAARRKMQPVVR